MIREFWPFLVLFASFLVLILLRRDRGRGPIQDISGQRRLVWQKVKGVMKDRGVQDDLIRRALANSSLFE